METWFERPWPTFSPRTEFFWVVKVRITKVGTWLERLGSILSAPWKKTISCSRKGCAAEELEQNSPGRIKKKYAMIVRLMLAALCADTSGR